MKIEVQAAFTEMLDISKDIDKAVLFTSAEVLASNFPLESQDDALAQAGRLAELGEARAQEMGSQPLTQMVVETPAGFVFFAREPEQGGMSIMATGVKGSRVGLVLYDLKTCMREAREALAVGGESDGDEAPATGLPVTAEGEES